MMNNEGVPSRGALHGNFKDDLATPPILYTTRGEGILTASQFGTDHFHTSS